MKLQDYPRPKKDNGIGMHFRLDLRENDNRSYVSQGVAWLQQIHAKWTLVAGQDWNQISKAAALIWQADIMPVCRLICKIDKGFIDWENGVKMLLDAGVPPYIQIFNEPGDSREWHSSPDINRFGGEWAEAAARVFDAGGYPGVGAVLGKDEWQAAFNALQANQRADVWERAWFCVHNYGSNHPINYPFDDVNMKGKHVTSKEYARMKFSLPQPEVNALRDKSVAEFAQNTDENMAVEAINTDDTTVLRFIAFKAWMVESLGYCLPMIGGEGGWQWDCEEDLRYSKLTSDQHALNHQAMFKWFKTGVLSNGDPLPDELFCLAPWIMADWGADDWWGGTLGTKLGTIDAVASLPTFVRKFSWDQKPAPAAPPPDQTIHITLPPNDDASTNTPTNNATPATPDNSVMNNAPQDGTATPPNRTTTPPTDETPTTPQGES